MSRPVKIAALQAPCWVEGRTPRERKAFLVRQTLALLETAGEAGADIACLGEHSTTHGVGGNPDDRTLYEDAEAGPVTKKVRRLARKFGMNIIFPIAAWHRGVLRNVALVINRSGELAGAYHKVHLTRGERANYVAGGELPVFRLDFGTIGVVICHDLSFVESVRVVALKGAELVFWPNWWSGWGEDSDWAQIRARAIDNSVWLVPVNFGQPKGRAWRPGLPIGRSGVIGPDGQTLGSAGRHVGMCLTPIDLDAPRIAHCFTWEDEAEFRRDMLADRRPETYGILTDPRLVPAARKPGAPAPAARRRKRRP
ncbi:MAG: carbon-nitrogen hydrolase family protein [Planctomycetota bacterium]